MKDSVNASSMQSGQRPTTAHRIHHPVLDVQSIQQGSLRLQIWLYCVAILVFLGLYFSVGAVINYQQVDSDARDMITNFRHMIRTREAAHAVFEVVCAPHLVSGVSAHDDLNATIKTDKTTVIRKARDKLPDPRLLPLTDVVQPMVSLRDKRNAANEAVPSAWTYYQATLTSLRFPRFGDKKHLSDKKLSCLFHFGWKSQLEFNVTFSISANLMLHGVQMFNTWPVDSRPLLTYKQTTNDNDMHLWNVEATFRSYLPAYKIERINTNGTVIVKRLSKVLIEVRYHSVDAPATFIETNVASERYKNGQPEFKRIFYTPNASEPTVGYFETCDKLFDVLSKCRDTISVPSIFSIQGKEYEPVYSGPLSKVLGSIPAGYAADIEVTIRDMSQPRPYTPLLIGFGQPFFTGFAFLGSAIITLLTWWGLRFHLVNKNVRENEGKPPMFYQGMLRFRGW